MPSFRIHERQQRYALRLLSCLAASLLLVVGLVRLWPAAPEAPEAPVYDARGRDLIEIDAVQQTTQAPAPPPPPLPPVPVPDDRPILEERRLDFTPALRYADTPTDLPPAPEGPPGEETRRGAAAEVPARRLSIVEPRYPEAARDHRVRPRVVVEVLVNEEGRVTEARIVERFLIGSDGSPRRVATLDYGLDQSALDAARRTLFIPARLDGQPVASRQRIPIGFGR